MEAKDLTKTFCSGDTTLTILDKITLKIEPSQTIALEGVSGSGKTTLLQLFAGLILPTQGHIRLMTHNLSHCTEDERAILRGKHIGFVFQSFQLLPSLTAIENVMLPLELQKTPLAREKAFSLLSRIGLDKRAHHYPETLSGGEQQRIAIARAFITKPKILLADEPTANIDQKTAQEIIDLLFQLNQEHRTTLIFSTHDLSLSKHCQIKWRLNNGRITIS